jgi:hypothetical protein
MKRILAIVISALVCIGLFSPPLPVYADISPPIPPNPSNIYPEDKTTQVRMVSETVTIDVFGETTGQGYTQYNAHVNAIFHMQNLGTEDEKMNVYFPMNYKLCSMNPIDADLATYTPIRDFTAMVNGIQSPITTKYWRFSDPYNQRERDTPCWVYFPATFRAGKEVAVQVKYLAPDEIGKIFRLSGYSYVLETGAGWKGTIGTADIVFHSPYTLTSEYLSGFSPGGGIIQGNSITWHLEDIEPTSKDNIDISILNPDIWKRIQIENQNVADHPNDGEAWGRLGKAYKDAAWGQKDFLRDDAAAEELYQDSFRAYTNAVSLKPGDADWHFGFAELLYFRINADPESHKELLPMCFDQIKAALLINPNHEDSIDLLFWMQQILPDTYGDNLIDKSQNPPVIFFLTPSATLKPTLSTTPAESTLTVGPSMTPRVTQTLSLKLPDTRTPGPSVTPTSKSISLGQPAKANHNNSWMIGVISLILAVIGLSLWMYRKR